METCRFFFLDDLVQGVLDYPFRTELYQLRHDLPDFLFVKDALYGDPVGVVEMGDGGVVEARQYLRDRLNLVVGCVHLQSHHVFGGERGLEEDGDGFDLGPFPGIGPR